MPPTLHTIDDPTLLGPILAERINAVKVDIVAVRKEIETLRSAVLAREEARAKEADACQLRIEQRLDYIIKRLDQQQTQVQPMQMAWSAINSLIALPGLVIAYLNSRP